MSLRISAAVLLAVLVTGCAWEGRPDGASGNHTPIDGTYDNEGIRTSDPVYDVSDEITVPLDDAQITPSAAPVDLTQPAPTTGTDDNTLEVEEALTSGTEQ